MTIDNDLSGTRARKIQAKLLRNKKAGKDSHTLNSICDTLFGVTLGVRYLEEASEQLGEGYGQVSVHEGFTFVDVGWVPL